MKGLWLRGALSIAVLLVATLLHAQAPDTTPTTEEQHVLAPFQSLLASLPLPLQARLREQARLWVRLSREEQDQLRTNLEQWGNTPPQEKLHLRERFEAWSHLDTATQAAALAAMQRHTNLSDMNQQRWRERFDALPSQQKEAFLFDPTTRANMALAEELFPFIPMDEVTPTLNWLKSLSTEQVAQLRQELARRPPAQRDTYRRQQLDSDRSE